MLRYLRIYKMLVKISLITFLNHRFNLLMGSVANLTWTAAQLLSLQFLFNKLPNFAGWEYGDLIILLALGQIYVYIAFMFYDINLDELPRRIIEGGFDQMLLKPVDVRFLASFEQVSIATMFSASVTIIPLLVYGMSLKHYPLENFVPAIIVLSLGVVILFLLRLAFAALAFFLDETDSLKGLIFNQMSEFNRVPVMILPRPLQVLLIYIVPIAFISFFPTQLLRGEISLFPIILLELGLLVVSYVVMKLLWQAGLRRYDSAA